MPGDCILVAGTGAAAGKYNMCVKAQRRTVFTNLDRVYTMKFLVSHPAVCQRAWAFAALIVVASPLVAVTWLQCRC